MDTTTISLGIIELDGIVESYTTEEQFYLPTNTSCLSSRSTVTIEVNVKDMDTRTFRIENILATGSVEGFDANVVSKYINVPVTTPYAILYLATEGLYAEIASSRSGIAEKIRSEYNVMLAGPMTVTALLNSLSLGFRAVAINEKANEVRVLLAAAKVQYDKFGVVLSKARQKIDEAGKSLDEAGKRNDIIRKKLNKVEEIDGMNADDILGLEETSDT
jgi:DNA anti-recombination protein RmuC